MNTSCRIVILFLLSTFSLLGQQSSGWQWTARGGAIGIPHTLSANRLGIGSSIGLGLETFQESKTGYSFTLDYRKINNLLMERLEEFNALLPDVAIRGREYLTLTGFAGILGGVHIDREVKRIGTGRLKLSLDGYVELMTTVFAKQESNYFATTFASVLLETDAGSYLDTTSGGGSSELTRDTSDDLSIVYAAGVGIIYEFEAGPKLSCGVFLDMNTRFSLFADSSDAKLTQVRIGFDYPFRTK